MRSRLLISIIGIFIVAVSIAGLLIELDSLKNPIDANMWIPLRKRPFANSCWRGWGWGKQFWCRVGRK